LIAAAAALIGMDSGPAHIAAAVGTAAVVISAHPTTGAVTHTGAPERFRPWGDPSRILVAQPARAQAPCVDGCDAGRAHCILGVEPTTLWPRLEAFIAAALAPQVAVHR
jgi:ADP-heptose:LPS heptosyltransferase